MSLANPTVRARSASVADNRAALVDALNTVPGVTGTPVAPDSATVGAAWPAWTETAFNGHVGDPSRHKYSVYVVLEAAEPETTVNQADALIAAIGPALVGVALVDAVEPVQITFGDQTTMPGLRFRVTTRA